MNLAAVRADPVTAVKATRAARAGIAHGAMQKLSELAPFLVLVARLEPRRIIEIGSGRGGTLHAVSLVCPADASFISIDLPEGAFGGSGFSAEIGQKLIRPTQRHSLIQANSHDPAIAAQVAELMPVVDLLLIDGDHTYQGVRADYELYATLVRRGGMIALHDIVPHTNHPDCEVHVFWRELPGPKREIVGPETNVHFGGSWGGIGVVEM
jgi:cephalosporin hydroxylase